MKCPCGSDIVFETCCGPLLEGTKRAPTALTLMRSRYTAYVRADIDYLERTLAPGELDSFDSESTRSWAEQSDWLGLEIVSVEKGEEKDKEGIVEFIARYRQNGSEEAHHERSLFFKSKGDWYFVGGCYIEPDSSEKATPRIGRSMDCPCGSGKKYKKCCG